MSGANRSKTKSRVVDKTRKSRGQRSEVILLILGEVMERVENLFQGQNCESTWSI